MKKILLTLLGIVVVVGILAGAGFAGYRYGYVQGAAGNGLPFVRGNGFNWERMPMHDNFGWNMRPGGFQRGMGGFGMLGLGGFGVLVGRREPTAATYALAGVDAVHAWLGL